MLRKIILIALVLIMPVALTACGSARLSPEGNKQVETENSQIAALEQAKSLLDGKKVLLVYFTRTGNTRELANQVHKMVGGDVFEIQVNNAYSGSYNETTQRAKQEKETGFRPTLQSKVANMKEYDIIFFGVPVWWGSLPMPVVTFLESYDLSGKTIIPFCTHGGGGQAQTFVEMAKYAPQATVLEGLSISGSSAQTAQSDVDRWLRKIKVLN